MNILNKKCHEIIKKLKKIDIVWIYKILDEYVSPYDKLEYTYNIRNEEISEKLEKYPWL